MEEAKQNFSFQSPGSRQAGRPTLYWHVAYDCTTSTSSTDALQQALPCWRD